MLKSKRAGQKRLDSHSDPLSKCMRYSPMKKVSLNEQKRKRIVFRKGIKEKLRMSDKEESRGGLSKGKSREIISCRHYLAVVIPVQNRILGEINKLVACPSLHRAK